MREVSIELDKIMPLIKEKLANGDTVQIIPNGTSMRPMLKGGRDKVILAPVPDKLKKYDLALYQRKDGQYVLHRIVRIGEEYDCIGDNQFAIETGIKREQIISVVSGFVRKNKEYSVNSVKYRIYCSAWHFFRPIRHIIAKVIGKMRRLHG